MVLTDTDCFKAWCHHACAVSHKLATQQKHAESRLGTKRMSHIIFLQCYHHKNLKKGLVHFYNRFMSIFTISFLPSVSCRLALYVYEYLLHVGAQKSAQTFLSEVGSLKCSSTSHKIMSVQCSTFKHGCCMHLSMEEA